MKTTTTVAALLGAIAAIAAWTACVGDDGGVVSTPADGGQNGACFANGSCLVGLACVNSVCVIGTDAGGSSSSSSSSSSSGFGAPGGDAGTATQRDMCGSLSDSDGPLCPDGPTDDVCNLGQFCCPGTGCGGAACATSYAFECFADDHCKGNANGTKCCVHAPAGSPPSGVECVNEFIAPTAGSKCEQVCAADEVELCSPATFATNVNTCAAGKTCNGVGIIIPDENGTYVKAVGLCE